MNIGFFINTPAQVHFTKGVIRDLRQSDHLVRVIVRDHQQTLELLEEINLDYTLNPGLKNTRIGRLSSFPKLVFEAFYRLRNPPPDIIFGFGDYAAITSFILDVPSIIFRNSPPKSFYSDFHHFLLYPFLDVILSPKSSRYLGSKQIKINSFLEMNYLAPNYFTPSPDIYELMGISREEEFILIRFNSFEAIHDLSEKGFNKKIKMNLIEKLKNHSKIFISSETELPTELKEYKLDIPKHRIHDVLYYAKMFISDTQTMALESALLGTPAIRTHSFVGKNDLGHFNELEEKFGLVYNFSQPEKVIDFAVKLVKRNDLEKRWKAKKEKLFSEKIDMREFLIWFIENYPQSFKIMKKNHNYQNKFKIKS